MVESITSLAFAMSVGPGEAEMAIDNLDAIQLLYPGAVTWVREDLTCDGTWEKLSEWTRGKEARIRLSRNPCRLGYYGIMKTFGQLLLEIAPTQPDLLIKIDPDTVLIRGGLDRIFRDRFHRYGPGISGSYLLSATGAPRRFRHHGMMVLLDTLPVGPKKNMRGLRRLRPGCTSYFRFIIRACMHGYRPGEHVQGGLYAIDGSTLQKLANSGFLAAVASGRSGMIWSEDVMLSLGVKAVGDTICSLNDSLVDAPSHIQAEAPLKISKDRLYSSSLLAIHPVKAADGDLRSLLRDLRLAAVSATAP